MTNGQDSAPKPSQQSLFYIYHQGEQKGPISLNEIASKVRSRELEMNDYLYDEAASDWTVLVAYPALSELIKDIKVAAPAPKVEPAKPADGADEWFALKGNLRFGPFAYTELVRLLQEKSMHDSDYVWFAGLKEWQKVADLPQFSADAIRKLRESGQSGLDEVFFRRRHARIQHDGSILMHNNQKVFRGKSLEISAGGAGIVLETTTLDVGHQVFLHFKPASDLPPFNAVCEVVSRRPVDSADALAPMHYGVKFLKIETKTTKAIEALAARHLTKKAS
jgi:hypothetical protein